MQTSLLKLTSAFGPSGREGPAVSVWQGLAEAFANTHSDIMGNAYAYNRPFVGTLRASDRRRIALAAHIDEIGFIVQSIDDTGCLWIAEVGGWDPQVLCGQRVTILGTNGYVSGVVGRKAIHLFDWDALQKACKFKELWVDIGAKTKAEAEALVRIGDMGVTAGEPTVLSPQRVCSKALDNRVGAFVVLEALRRLRNEVDDPQRFGTPEGPEVLAVVTAREEVGLRGAKTAVEYMDANIVIAVDVTHATDVGSVDKQQLGEHPLGSGPVITRGAFHSPAVERALLDAATMPHTIKAVGGSTGTDADAFALGGRGVATGLVSVPLRYMHTPGEVVDLEDIEHTVQLLVNFCRTAKDLNLLAR